MLHRYLDYMSPNEITEEVKLEYIDKMKDQVNPHKFKPGDSVRIILDANLCAKKCTNLSKESYIIDSKSYNKKKNTYSVNADAVSTCDEDMVKLKVDFDTRF